MSNPVNKHKPNIDRPKAKMAFAIAREDKAKLAATAAALGRTPSSLLCELVEAFNRGEMKLPANAKIKEVYR